jgi:hypothetical protein
MREPSSRLARPVWIGLLIWLSAATALAASGLLARLPVPPPAFAGALTILLFATLLLSPAVRERVRALGLRALVAFHIVRIAAGAWFLVLYRRGELPDEFAIAAGWGDIAVGIGAVAVCVFCFPLVTSTQRKVLLVWNAVGLLDILGVLANGVRLFLRDPALGEPFTRLPVGLLPTFVVPLVVVSHVLLFVWARGAQGSSR